MAVQRVAPRLRGPTLSSQRWENLTFLHWPIDPESVASRFPTGVRVDTLDGVTYVGLVPFHMRGAGPGAWPPVPYFGDFCETNVRLYSVDDAGRHGIVFLTLDAQRLATVVLARVSLGLPYAWSAMGDEVEDDEVEDDVHRYRSRRRWPGRRAARGADPDGHADRAGPYCDLSVRVGAPVEPTPVEVWLTSRWGLHTRVAGRTLWVPNQHPPWPLFGADLLDLDSNLVEACGVQVGDAAMLRPLWSPGVHTTFGLPRVVGGNR